MTGPTLNAITMKEMGHRPGKLCQGWKSGREGRKQRVHIKEQFSGEGENCGEPLDPELVLSSLNTHTQSEGGDPLAGRGDTRATSGRRR